MKNFISAILLTLGFIFTTNAANALDKEDQADLCRSASALMNQYWVDTQDKALKVCQGFAGCVYIPPSGRGSCVAADNTQSSKDLCRSASALMNQYWVDTQDKALKVCQGFAGCVYIPSSGRGSCVSGN